MFNSILTSHETRTRHKRHNRINESLIQRSRNNEAHRRYKLRRIRSSNVSAKVPTQRTLHNDRRQSAILKRKGSGQHALSLFSCTFQATIRKPRTGNERYHLRTALFALSAPRYATHGHGSTRFTKK